MAVEDIGNLVPTKIPALIDDANIQDALRAYHYGSYDFDTSESDPAELLNPSIAYTINDIQDQIDTLETLEENARDISRISNSAPVANDFSSFSETIPDGYIWVDKDTSLTQSVYSSTAVYADEAPTQNLTNGLIWVDKNESPITMYAYNAATSSWDAINTGPSGVVSVSSPIQNTGTSSSAQLELNFSTGLELSGSDLVVDYSTGLTISGNSIIIDKDPPLKFDGNSLGLDYGNGLRLSDTTLVVDESIFTERTLISRISGNSSTTADTMPVFAISTAHTVSSGNVYIYYFTPLSNMTITNITMANTTASTDATLARMGLYSVDGSTNDLTLVARTNNHTPLFRVANTSYTLPLNDSGGYPLSYSLIAGQRYAVGVILVGQTIPAQLIGGGSSIAFNSISTYPKISAVFGSQTDLPSSIDNDDASVIDYSVVWARLS